MADFGFQGFPEGPKGVDQLTHIRTVLEMAPPQFSTVWISDHLQFEAAPRFEGWTLLTYLAAAFPRFRYGHLVLSQSFRNPALLAKMAASLQELTGGRFIMGIGAYQHDFYPGQTFHVFGPTPADAIREIEKLVDVGVSHFQVLFEDMTTYHRFIEEVVPVVRLERRPEVGSG